MSPRRGAIVVCLLLGPALVAQEIGEVDILLDRLSQYLAAYESELATVIAEEHYEQAEYGPLNRANLANPNTNISSGSAFGRITGPLNNTYGTGTARQMQFMLRFNF